MTAKETLVAEEPPPYSPIAEPSQQVPVQEEGEVEQVGAVVPPINVRSEPYHPASFPGYSALQVSHHQECSPLLPSNPLRRQRRVRVRRSHHGFCRCMFRTIWGCGCCLFGVLVATWVVVMVGSMIWDLVDGGHVGNCYSLEMVRNSSFQFPLSQALTIESKDGIMISDVFVNGHQSDDVRVQAVVETAKGYPANVQIAAAKNGESRLVIRNEGPKYQCVKTSLYISVPRQQDKAMAMAMAMAVPMAMLDVVAGTGTLTSVRAGKLALDQLHVSIRNGAVQLEHLEVGKKVNVHTTNAAIRALGVKAGQSVDLETSNGLIQAGLLDAGESIGLSTTNAHIRSTRPLQAPRLLASSSNGGIEMDDVVATSQLHAKTTNGRVRLQATDARRVDVESRNAGAEVRLKGFMGGFDVRTSNSRALVSAREMEKLRVDVEAKTRQKGVYGERQNGSNVRVVTTNARANLVFV